MPTGLSVESLTGRRSRCSMKVWRKSRPESVPSSVEPLRSRKRETPPRDLPHLKKFPPVELPPTNPIGPRAAISYKCSIRKVKRRRRSLAPQASRMTPPCGNIYLSERPRTHESAGVKPFAVGGEESNYEDLATQVSCAKYRLPQSVRYSIKSKADFANVDFESERSRRQSSRGSIRARWLALQGERPGPDSPAFLN